MRGGVVWVSCLVMSPRFGLHLGFLLPIRIETRAFSGDLTEIVPAFPEPLRRHFAERHPRPSHVWFAFRRDAFEAKRGHRDRVVLLEQTVSGEFQDRFHAQRRESLVVVVKPATVLGLTACIAEFARPAAELERL